MKTMRRGWTLLSGAALLAATLMLGAPAATAAEDDERVARDARAKAYAHLMRSTVAARKGELKKAADEVQAAIKLQPDSAAIHAQAATMLYQLGRGEQAENAARRAQEIEPDHPQTLRFLADRATDRARRSAPDDVATHEEALRLLNRLKQLGHADEEILHWIRAIRLRLGDDDGALEAARELVEMRPGDKQAVSQLIGLLLEQKNDIEALDTVLGYVTKHPNDIELLGFAQELAGRLDEWERVDRALASEPGLDRSNTVAQRLWAVALLERNEILRAAQAFERALLAQPDDPNLRFDAARTYRAVGRLADASTLLHELAGEAPSDPRVLLMLGETLTDQSVIDGALNALVSALRLFSADGDRGSEPLRDAIRRMMMQLYMTNEQLPAAWDLHAELEQRTAPQTMEMAARLAIREKDWPRARAEIKKLREGGEPGVAALLEGEVWLRSDKAAKAAPLFEDAVAKLGPYTRGQIAEIHLELERHEPGAVWLQDWTAAEGDNPDAHYYLGSYLFRAFGLERAEASLRRVIELDPEHAPALNFLGYSLAEVGVHLEESVQLIERALALDPWNGAYLDSLGWAYYRLDRFEDAREPLEAAAREFPADAVILEHLGDLYQRIGEDDLAITAWGQALDNGPEDPSKIEAKIARLSTPAGNDRR